MKKGQQGVAIAVCSIGLIVLAISGAVLVSKLREERTARRTAEVERDHLLERVKLLEKQAADLGRIRFKRFSIPLKSLSGPQPGVVYQLSTGVPETPSEPAGTTESRERD